MLFASRFFRRGFHENSKFAPRFIEYFWNQHFEENEVSIALDFDSVRIDMEGPMILELDT